MIDVHKKDCSCTYCKSTGSSTIQYGLNIPTRWSDWNSWYVIKIWDKVYIRWINRWFFLLKAML